MTSMLRRSFHARKINVGSHAGAETIVVVRQPNLDPEYLFDAVFHRLHVTRRKLGLTIDLLDHARKIFAPKRIDAHTHLIAEFNFAKTRFWNIHADPKMLRQKQGRDFLVKRRYQNVAHLDVEHFENRFG